MMADNPSRASLLTPTLVIDKRMEQLHFRGVLISLLAKLAVIILAVFLTFTLIFGVAIQKGEGMYPRVRDGDLMLYYRLTSSFENGDIITLTRNGVRYTGRIVAKAGDTVNTSAEGKLIVNGAIQYEEIYYETYTQGSTLTYPYTIPENSFFILGDMRTGASDSRDIGAVTKDEIEGKLITILRRRGL